MTSPFQLATTPIGPGTTLLEASAGTGKTYALVGMVLRLLLEGSAPSLGSVLVVTFTVAATEELKTRLRQALQRGLQACRGEPVDDAFLQQLGRRHGPDGAAILRRALREFDDLSVSTIHGFCRRLLEESAFESGCPFRSDFVEDEIPPTHRAAAAALRHLLQREDRLVAALCVADGITPHQLVRTFLTWRRHPGIRLLPEAAPLSDALAQVAQALAAATAAVAATPDLAQRVAGLTWLKNKQPPATTDPDVFADRLTDLCNHDPTAALPLLVDVGGWDKQLYRRKSANHTLLATPFCRTAAQLAVTVAAACHSLRLHLLAATEQRLQQDKAQDNVMVFQDLLERVHRAVHDDAGGEALVRAVQARHAAALIDEFQDTDRLQYEIFARCFRGRPLFLIGDPKQSIYGFRGADVHAYLQAQERATARHTLPENHRSHPDLVTTTVALFRRSPRPFVDRRIAVPDVTPAQSAMARSIAGEQRPALQWRLLPAPADGKTWNKDRAEGLVVQDVVAEIARLVTTDLRIDDAPLSPSDIAVLTRTNAQATAVQDALRSAGVHSAIGKAGDIFDSDEIDELDRLLQALIQPQNQRLVRAAWATRLWGRDAATIHAIREDAEWERERARLERWRRLWLRHGLVVMAEDLLATLRVRERMLARADGERRLTNFLQVIELLHGAEIERHLTPEGLLLWLQHERVHQQDIDYQRRELRLESDADAVKILTVHGAKGLEYPVVFCPFLWDAHQVGKPPFLFHGADDVMTLDLGSTGDAEAHAKAAAERERLSEDLRLLYVALTRAGRRCYVHWCAGYNSHRSALTWLLLPPATGTADDLAAWQDNAANERPRWPDHLRALVDQHAGAMELQLVREPTAAPAVPPRRPMEPPPARPLPQRLPEGLVLLSFTSLAAGGRPAADEAEAREHADPAAPAEPMAPAAAAGMAAFARGAVAGRCLHAILERLDLPALHRDPDHAASAALVDEALREHGLHEPAAHTGLPDPAGALHAMLRDLAGARSPELGLRFDRLRPQDGQAEWQFVLPARSLRPRSLAPLFRQHGQGHVGRYAERLQALGGRPLDGYLVGFVDLLANQNGRWFVIDWKSNHLGAGPEAYAAAALERCMHEHDYVLQYHLYVLAVHLLLQRRVAGYHYDRHFGGVCYPFLRGVRAGTADGLYVDRPPAALIAALERWATGEAPR